MHTRATEFSEIARDRYDFDPDIEEFPAGTKTAADAAEAVGCAVGQIASSIVVETEDGLAVVVTSGANRVDMDLAAEVLGVEHVSMADADEVRETEADLVCRLLLEKKKKVHTDTLLPS